jgi:DNA processing protein
VVVGLRVLRDRRFIARPADRRETLMGAPVELIALSLLPVWRWRMVAEQLRDGMSPSDILETHCADGVRGRARPPAWADAASARARATESLARAQSSRIAWVVQGDAAYPSLLLQIADPPPVLWVSGQPAALSRLAVAIVGSRAASPYAVEIAERLASDLAARGVAVVSGLARGVDSAAHRGALSAEGITVAVVGSGVDVIYPPEHVALATQIAATGAVVSELMPGTTPRPGFFPRRNRIISGLVRGVVVIEAGQKSGSLITARCALEQGRDVLAVPGNVLSGRNRGGHALIRDGARIVETAEDIIEELGCSAEVDAAAGRPGRHVAGEPVLDALVPGEPCDLGQISTMSGLSVGEVLRRLMELELRGAVRREPGGRFVRFDRTC